MLRSLRSFLRRGERGRLRLTRLKEEVEALRRQLDAVKSSLEVPPAMIDEFFDWKERHPLPGRPLVSVCVATWNRAGLLTERCIPSVLGQTWDRLERMQKERIKTAAPLSEPKTKKQSQPVLSRGQQKDDAILADFKRRLADVELAVPPLDTVSQDQDSIASYALSSPGDEPR